MHGVLNSDGEAINLASMADWHDAVNLDISGEAGDVNIETDYPGMLLKQFGNKGTTMATIICTTANGSPLTVKCPVGGITGKLPIISDITQTNTSDNLVLYFQAKAQ